MSNMRTIVTISIICVGVFSFSQNENNNKNNSGNFNNSNVIKETEKKELRTVEEAEELPATKTAVFDSQFQTKRYNYEFTRKRFKIKNQTKGFSSDQQDQLDAYLEDLRAVSNESFEYNYLTYVNGNHNVSLFKHLLKAYELKPYDSNLYDDFIAYYEITGDESKKSEFAKKLMKSNTIESGVYKYNENVLRSIDKNGILITNGYDDTYPIWVLQTQKGMRKDVRVLSLDLLQNKDYRKNILKKYGLKDPGVGPENKEFIYKLCQLNPSKNLFLGYTVPKFVLKSLAINLKNTGLALKYSPNKLNEDKLKINYENELQLDYLMENQSSNKVKKLNANYLISLVQLHAKYKHDLRKQDYIKKIALKVAKDIGQEKMIKNSLGN